MAVFKKHYTREEARQLLPQVRQWLAELDELRRTLHDCEEYLAKAMTPGEDLGGDRINRYVKSLAGVKEILVRFQNREIQLKDLDRGLIDFPSYIGGKE